MKSLLLVALLAGSAAAEPAPAPKMEGPGPAPGPAVDPGDLPPLPAASEDEASSAATVLAAASAEEDVVVGAAKREQSLGNVASAVTVVSADRIRRFGYRTVGEAVAAVAGVYLVDNRLSYSVGIRGLNIPGDYNTRILVLVDGASINEGWGSFAGLGYDTFVSIDDVSRIEVIRGPVSSLYGANAFFGIINIVTRGAAETPHAWAKSSINSINGSITSAGFAQGGVHQQLRGSVQFMDRIGETLTVPSIAPTPLAGDGSLSYAASLVGSYEGTFGQVRAYRYKRDSPFAPYNGDVTSPEPYHADDSQLLVEGGHTRELTKRLTVAGRVYANLYSYTDHIIQTGDAPFDDQGRGDTYGVEVRGRYELVAPQKLGLTAGTEATYYRTYSKSFTEGNEACAPGGAACVPKNFNIEGVYAELDGQPTPNIGFTGGVRFDNNSVIDRRLSPRAALFISEPEKYGLKLLFAQGFRNPSAYEAFFYDNTSFTQPVDIHAETIDSFETVAWAKPIHGLSLRLSGFYWDANHVVEQLPDAGTGLLQFQNAGHFVTYGGEAEGSYRTTQGWYGFGGLTIERVGESVGAGDLAYGDVPNAPAVIGSLGISTPRLFGRAHLSGAMTYLGERATRPDLMTGALGPRSPAWLGLDATIYVPNVSGFDITAGVRNIIGTRDRVVAPGDYDRTVDPNNPVTVFEVPGEGRELFLKVGYAY
ncbi:MAG TPA: TonB-dependent receptor [Kofleriaceae bacterium]|nr:TonB-dependent receptor [Kofleriaceae bacterium]